MSCSCIKMLVNIKFYNSSKVVPKNVYNKINLFLPKCAK
ncbi:hypothetical protein [Citrobacter freundii]|uniref:Uncharacterized protein n=1 Tax=Citrobacter freundii TaxID=546 RepID=A0A7G2IZP9_CITFR|nr:hypothetical protein [Citrobacter freundii]